MGVGERVEFDHDCRNGFMSLREFLLVACKLHRPTNPPPHSVQPRPKNASSSPSFLPQCPSHLPQSTSPPSPFPLPTTPQSPYCPSK